MIEHPVPALQVNAPRPYWHGLLVGQLPKIPDPLLMSNVTTTTLIQGTHYERQRVEYFPDADLAGHRRFPAR